MATTPQERINAKIAQVKQEHDEPFVRLLTQVNKTHLHGKGKLTAVAEVDRNSLRWTLAWTADKIDFDLNIVVNIADDGKQAHIDRVWVHRHVSAPFDHEGHTPTTHMRRLTSLSIAEIKEAIETEFK